MLGLDFLIPSPMYSQLFIILNGLLASQPSLSNQSHILLQTRWQYSQAHNLNQADILLLDMMYIGMRMEDTQRILLISAIVAQY